MLKREARRHRGTDRLAKAAPASPILLTRAAARGDNLGTITAALLRLLDRYGAAELQAAILDALARDVPHPMQCVWLWSAGGRNCTGRRPSRSACPSTCESGITR